MQTTTKRADELSPGDHFQSPRASEGEVKVVCAYGQCTHDERPSSVHVKKVGGSNQWFIAIWREDEIEVWA